MATTKLTPVQKQVMKRFENGEKLVQLETNRMSGDVLFWCSFDEESGLWCATEKALQMDKYKDVSMNSIQAISVKNK